jgi:Holliday junction resolvasome RuvABC DNA-binding subunit
MAPRLVLELKDKLPDLPAAAHFVTDASMLLEEAQLALVSLGLSQRAAREAVEKVERGGLGREPRVEDIVKAALQSGRVRE